VVLEPFTTYRVASQSDVITYYSASLPLPSLSSNKISSAVSVIGAVRGIRQFTFTFPSQTSSGLLVGPNLTYEILPYDTTPPAITLNGSNPQTVYRGTTFTDLGATVTDDFDATRTITGSGTVDTTTVGSYTLTYSAEDEVGNVATPITRTVEVVLDPSGDEDSDGLNNTEEATLGTNPYLRDTDGDGVNDLREVGDGSDPLGPASFDSLSLGLVAYYPFSGSANDESGNGLDLVNNGATYGEDLFGNVHSAANFSAGTNRPPSQNFNNSFGGQWMSFGSAKPLRGLSAVTISMWLKPGTFLPAAFGNAATGQILYQETVVAISQHGNSPRRLGFVLGNGSSWFNDGVTITNNTFGLSTNGVWLHCVYTADSTGQKIYANGVLALSSSKAIIQLGANSYTLGLGAYYNGATDNLRIYNRSLNADEVALLFANEQYSGSGLEGAATKSPFDPATAANWSAGGTEWTVDTTVTHDGVDSVKARSTDGQFTYREYTVTGPAVVDFWWKVSSEELYDTFSYSLNGVSQQTISGEVDWTYRTLTLPAGTHTLRWTYTKDASDGVGQDAGWVDDFAVYPATATLQVRDGAIVLSGITTVDFGSADLGSANFTKSLTFANEGYVPLEMQLSLPEGSPFTFEGEAATYELLIGRGESVDVPIAVSTAVRGTKTAQLTISAPDSTAAPPQITLTGDVLGPVIGITAGGSPVASGQTIDLGLAPRSLQFTISNTGNVGNLEIASVSASGSFQIAEQPQPSVAPQSSTTFTVLALGGTSGVQSGAVTITSNDSLSEVVAINLSSKSLFSISEGISADSVFTSGVGGAMGWDFAATQLPLGQTGQALKTGPTPNSGGSALEFTTQTTGVVSWSWKVGSQENFDWLLCEVDGQEVAGISTKNGVWQTQVVQVPAGANVRWVYRKDASGSAGEDAGYLADVEFRSFAANQPFSEWAQIRGIYDPQQRMPKSGMQAMFGWLGGFRVDGDAIPDIIVAQGRLTYRYPVSKTADGTQQILFSSDMSAWTTRRISQRIVSEDADRMVIEATAPSGARGFFKVTGSDNPRMVRIDGGILSSSSQLAGAAVAAFQIGKTEVMWGEWQAVRTWSVSNGYDLAGVGQGSGPGHPVREVTWYEALKWCNAKSEMEGYTPVYSTAGALYRTGSLEPTINPSADGYRLPTEAEWEWAARGGVRSNGYIYSGSNDLDAVAWYRTNSLGASVPLTRAGRGTWPARSKVANELGLYDMNGNTWEWCWDGGGAGGRRIRGGSFINEPFECDLHHRGYIATPSDRGTWRDLGFRVARDVADAGNASVAFVGVQGGSLPQSSGLAGTKVSDFRIGKTEVTWAEWQEVRDWAGANGYFDLTNIGGGSGPDHPVRHVNWYDVAKWCNAKSERDNLNPVYLNGGVIYRMGNSYAEPDPSANGYRLPTEVEWEWAARGGTISQNYIYVGSNDLNSVGWYHENSVGAPLPLSNGRGTWPVGMKQPNELGLYDMSGNVVEWCFDSVNGNGENRRFRGGSWGWTAEYCTVGSRYWFFGTINRASDVGFRLARNAD